MIRLCGSSIKIVSGVKINNDPRHHMKPRNRKKCESEPASEMTRASTGFPGFTTD